MIFEKKIIVSNKSALISKYGQDNFDVLEDFWDSYINNDRNRGINTQVVYFDDKKSMKGIGNPYTGKPGDSDYQAKVKAIIDKIYTAKQPNYLCIVGAPDVVPHIDLDNPAYVAGGGDPDPIIPSDLPYASSTAYTKKVEDYLKSMNRSVGRIPGRNGVGDDGGFQNLMTLLMTSAAHTPGKKSEYNDAYFSITMQVGTRPEVYKSIDKQLFGKEETLTSPTAAPDNITRTKLVPKSHDLTLHGSSNTAQWFGENKDNDGRRHFPVAMDTGTIKDNISAYTVVAANPCYGAQLYNPGGMVNAYLEEHTLVFYGSTNVSYSGPPSVMYGDKMVLLFLQNILDGNPAGDAVLAARTSYISGVVSSLTPSDLKTIAQGILLGDPASTPIDTTLSDDQKNMMNIVPHSNQVDLENLAFRRLNARRNTIQHLNLLTRGQGPVMLKRAEGFVTHPDVEAHIQQAVETFGMEIFHSERMKRPESHHADTINSVGEIAGTNEVHHFVHVKPIDEDLQKDGILNYYILHFHEVNDKVRDVKIIAPN